MQFISWWVGWLAEAVFNLASHGAEKCSKTALILQNQAVQQGKNGGPTGGHGAGTTAGHHWPEFHYSGWQRLFN